MHLHIILLCLSGAALFFDLRTRKIPNLLCVIGTAAACFWQLWTGGQDGVMVFTAGSIIPVLLLFPLFRFRMLGAGDIKLLAALGGFMGGKNIFYCIVWSFGAGAILSLVLLIKNRNMISRFSYLIRYLQDYQKTKVCRPYCNGTSKGSTICFTIPVFTAIVLYIGGIY